LLRFEQRRGMLRNILTPPVPRLAAQFAQKVLADALDKRQLQRRDIHAWIWHSGGRDVLNELAEHIGLDETDLRWSREVLSEYGNMSSPSVLFALQRALDNQAPPGWWWLSSFGAGFSCHGALLNVSYQT
jgi:Predicted naringenin-chalcone synthase